MDGASFDVQACLEQVRQRDQTAARELVEHLYPLVIRIVLSKLPWRESEEDLTQEIFLKMFSKLDQYQGSVPFEHWVSRIAVNHCLNALRAQKNRPEWRWADLTEEQANAKIHEAASDFFPELPWHHDTPHAHDSAIRRFAVKDFRTRTGPLCLATPTPSSAQLRRKRE